jgi:2-desacetyl-2-hydroxyethyl bacteriochlorophyllide A dehydrogenase
MINRLGRIVSAKSIDFIEREIPEIGEYQVLIRIKASCICGSDLHIYKDKHPAVKPPVTIGHEFAGEVVKIGSEVSNVKIGDRVTVEPVITCGKCSACRHGDYGYCENISFTYRCGDGAMADYFIGNAERVFKLPDEISYEEGALVEPMAVALHAVKRSNIRLGDKVAVIGAGAIGIFVAAICRYLGAAEVVVSDFSEFRLDIARQMGATRTVCASKEDMEKVISDMSGGKGFDKAFECVGMEQTFNQAIRSVRTNGLVTDIGIFEKQQVTFDASILVKKEIRIQGSQGYCWDFDDAVRLIGELKAKRLITHYFPLDRLKEAFDTLMLPGSNAIKVCLIP